MEKSILKKKKPAIKLQVSFLPSYSITIIVCLPRRGAIATELGVASLS
jgi:hypothetical protein